MTIWIVVAMGAITFLLRFTPLLLVDKIKVDSDKRGHWLVDNLPLAVLSALIIPDIFHVDESTPWVGVSAGIVAIGLASTRKVPLVMIIIISVVVAYAVKQLTLN